MAGKNGRKDIWGPNTGERAPSAASENPQRKYPQVSLSLIIIVVVIVGVRLPCSMEVWRFMPNPKIAALTRNDIIDAAKSLKASRRAPKWTAIIEGKELPARPLVLEAAGVAPNDSTNSHQAVAILKDLGFETRYEGKTV